MTTHTKLIVKWLDERISKMKAKQIRTTDGPEYFAIGGQLTALKQVRYQLTKKPCPIKNR